MTKRPEICTIFFDLDGTLVDTEPLAARSIERCFKDWNVQLDSKDAHYVTGRTWDSALEFLFQKYTVPLTQKEASRAILSAYREILRKEIQAVPGAIEAVHSLSKEFPLALISGSHREEIFTALDALKITSFFKTILGAEDYPRSKPAPDGFQKALQILGAEPQKTLLFEDSTAGIASGLTAGLWVAALTSTNHFGQDQSKAHWRIEDLKPVNVQWVRELHHG